MKIETSELDLLKGLAENDRKAIETIYKENYKMVQTLVINNSGSEEEAKDIFQESMIVLYEKVKSGTFELNCLLKTYIYSVSRRLWLKRLNQLQKMSTSIDAGNEVAAIEEDMALHDKMNADYHLMENAMVKLGEPCKSLLEAYYLEKKNMVEIAGNFGYTNADNAKNQKYKCLMRLKKIFFDQYNKNRE